MLPVTMLDLRRILADPGGNAGIIFGLLAVPIVALGGSGFDIGRAIIAEHQMQSSADAAVLAGASLPQSATTQQRTEAALKVFNANIGDSEIIPKIVVNQSTVALKVGQKVPTSFLKLAHVDEIEVSAESSATARYANPKSSNKVCLLALDPASKVGIHIQGANKISYLKCWAHTNSGEDKAINANGSNAKAIGDGHCAVGNYNVDHDNFSPMPTAGCREIEDPFATVGAYEKVKIYQPKFSPPPIPNHCKHRNLVLNGGVFVLEPGKYCGGINIQAHATVMFKEGIFVVDDGLFKVQSGSHVHGTNVLFYFRGPNARMTIIGGGLVNLAGRRTGFSHEGFLFISHPDAWRGGEWNIRGGGAFKLEGMLYAPTNRIEVAGNGHVNGNSKYFGMVAKDFYFRGNGEFHLKVHDGVSQVPDIMPLMPSDAELVAVHLDH